MGDQHSNNNNGALIPPGGLEVSTILPTYTGGEESFVWFGLVLLATKTKERNLTALITLLHLVVRMFLLNHYSSANSTSPSTQYFRRQQQQQQQQQQRNNNTHNQRCDDGDGMAASIVLVPVLLQSIYSAGMHHHHHHHHHQDDQSLLQESINVLGQQLQLYAFSISIALPFVWQPYRFKWLLIPIVVVVVMAMYRYLFLSHYTHDYNYPINNMWWQTKIAQQFVFVASWMIFYASLPVAKSLHQVFTKGEWIMVTSLMAVATTELIIQEKTLDRPKEGDDDNSIHHQLVSTSLLLGSGLAFATVDLVMSLFSSLRNHLLFKLVYLATIPVACIELALWLYASAILDVNNHQNFHYPRSLFWLLDFLSKSEEPMVMGYKQQQQQAFMVPRFYWLLYWMVILAIAIPLAPSSSSSSSKHSVVLTRKWFHFIAILLFTPVTLAAPQLQSLSYAIAVALLLLIECIRHDLPFIQRFYATYLDTAKGEGAGKSMVISHLALIVGCAAPLWLTEIIVGNSYSNNDNNYSMNVLTALWGVLTLGVGDAMGAVVGTTVGRIRWGYGRTVEGSLAMWLSMMFACYLILHLLAVSKEQAQELLPVCALAVTLLTLLEAFTLQLDNLILPLAGVAVLFLQSIF